MTRIWGPECSPATMLGNRSGSCSTRTPAVRLCEPHALQDIHKEMFSPLYALASFKNENKFKPSFSVLWAAEMKQGIAGSCTSSEGSLPRNCSGTGSPFFSNSFQCVGELLLGLGQSQSTPFPLAQRLLCSHPTQRSPLDRNPPPSAGGDAVPPPASPGVTLKPSLGHHPELPACCSALVPPLRLALARAGRSVTC